MDQSYLLRLMIARYDESLGQFSILNTKQALGPGEYIFDVALSPLGEFYFLTTEGLSTYDIQKNYLQRIYSIDQFPTRDLNDLFISEAGAIYIATSKGLFVSNDQGKKFSQMKASGLSRGHFNSIVIDRKNNFYLGTESGLIVSLDGGKKFKKVLVAPEKPSSNYNHIYKCFLSPHSVVACTSWHGVFIFDRLGERFRETPVGSAPSSQIAFDSKGRLYAVEGVGNTIYQSDSKLATFNAYKDEWGLQDLTLSHCAIDSKDRVYAYSYKDFVVKDPNQKSFRTLKIPSPNRQLNDLNRLLETKSGQVYWVSWITPFGDLED